MEMFLRSVSDECQPAIDKSQPASRHFDVSQPVIAAGYSLLPAVETASGFGRVSRTEPSGIALR